MHDRTLLGAADVSDEELAAIVARSLRVSHVDVLWSRAEVVDYDLEALTTAGRFWVRGSADVVSHQVPFTLFVKVVQSWERSPIFAYVPQEMRELAIKSVPWRSEPEVYRSDLIDRLPPGLSMPRALAVNDLDEASAAIWLEAIDVDDTPWDLARFDRAAYMLGRLSANARVRELGALGDPDGDRTVRAYAEGRVAVQVLPALAGDELWQHPLIATAFDESLRDDLRAAGDRLPAYVAELEALPHLVGHGDACPRNLLVTRPDTDLVMIDFGFWSVFPVGMDLSQLVLGEIQLGERPVDDLATIDARCLAAYVDGLAAEGTEIPLAVVRRAHALLMLVFSGLSAVPFEHLDSEPTPELAGLFAARAATARYILDLVKETEPIAAQDVQQAQA